MQFVPHLPAMPFRKLMGLHCFHTKYYTHKVCSVILICLFCSSGSHGTRTTFSRHLEGGLTKTHLDAGNVEEIETVSIVLGILSLVCCVGCVSYCWYSKKEQYHKWINEDVPRYIVLWISFKQQHWIIRTARHVPRIGNMPVPSAPSPNATIGGVIAGLARVAWLT